MLLPVKWNTVILSRMIRWNSLITVMFSNLFIKSEMIFQDFHFLKFNGRIFIITPRIDLRRNIYGPHKLNQ